MVGTHTHPSEPRLSEIFARTLDANADGVVVLGEVLDKAGDRGYGFLLILLAIPAFIPILPPGTSGVLGVLLIGVGLANHDIYFLSAGWAIGVAVALIVVLGVEVLMRLAKIARETIGI